MSETSTQQDILAGRINAAIEEWDVLPAGQGAAHVATHVAAALTAAGYVKPRQVSTVEELDALPGGTIIRDAKGIGWQMFNKISDKPAWLPATRQEGFYFSSNLVEADRTPATVLYSPVVAG